MDTEPKITIGLSTETHGQDICPVNFNPMRRPWAVINEAERFVNISYFSCVST
jgi:hypothetical protein